MNKIVILLFLTLILFSSCAMLSYGTYNPDRIAQIEIGMSKDNILKLFGSPSYRRMNNEFEEWEYQYINQAKKGFDVLIVHFNSNRVSAIDSYFLPDAPQVAPHPHPHPHPRTHQ